MTDVVLQTPNSTVAGSSYVEWAPIFAGSVLALTWISVSVTELAGSVERRRAGPDAHRTQKVHRLRTSRGR